MSERRSSGWQKLWRQIARRILGDSSGVTAEWIHGYQAGAEAMYEDMFEDGWRKVPSIEEMETILHRIDHLLPDVLQEENTDSIYTRIKRVKAQALRYRLIGATTEDRCTVQI